MTRRIHPMNFGRIVIGAVLVAAVFCAISVHSTYQREQRIAQRINTFGGRFEREYCGPNWIPPSIRDRLALFDRIESVYLNDRPVTAFEISELTSLTNLEELLIKHTQLASFQSVCLLCVPNIECRHFQNAFAPRRMPSLWVAVLVEHF